MNTYTKKFLNWWKRMPRVGKVAVIVHFSFVFGGFFYLKKKKIRKKRGGKGSLNCCTCGIIITLASEENRPIPRSENHMGFRLSRWRSSQKLGMDFRLWVSQMPHPHEFPAASNFCGAWLLAAAVGSGLSVAGFPAANNRIAARLCCACWCFKSAQMGPHSSLLYSRKELKTFC